jgi:hypothetical protein
MFSLQCPWFCNILMIGHNHGVDEGALCEPTVHLLWHLQWSVFVVQLSWCYGEGLILCCSLHLTTMCLQYKPTVVACFCIHLACKWSNWEVSLLYSFRCFFVTHLTYVINKCKWNVSLCLFCSCASSLLHFSWVYRDQTLWFYCVLFILPLCFWIYPLVSAMFWDWFNPTLLT